MQTALRENELVSLIPSPTVVVSEWVYLPAFSVSASLHPDPPSSRFGCGKRANLRLTIGHWEPRDSIGECDWRTSGLPAPLVKAAIINFDSCEIFYS